MDTLRGIALMTLAMASFAVEDMIIKMLAEKMPLGQILLFIGLFGAIAFGMMARSRNVSVWSPVLLTPPLLLRNLAEVLGTVLFVTAIGLLPLSVVASILQAAPLFVALGGAVFLGAPVGWRRWLAIAVGFVGVLMILRPGADSFEPLALLALGATICLSIRDLTTRAAPRDTPYLVLTTSGFVMVTIAGLVLMPFGAPPVWPDGISWLLLVFAIGAAMVAYTSITAAMRIGDLAAVTPFRYTRLLFSLAIGVMVFDERPDLMTLAGAAVILGSGLYTLLRERQVALSAARTS
ncbi:MAG: DMT family transporter [Pseudomonadota bacterium]